jgi:hypothetical protein
MKKTLALAAMLIGFVLSANGQIDHSTEIQTLPDGTKYLVHPSRLRSGGPPKDGIPSIDDPVFESVEKADKWLQDEDLVIVLSRGDTIRMYPFDILVWHEIVNDVVDGDPILITYCPLCGSAIAFIREIDGEAVEFGTSGKLYNSNLIMYDRLTESYWTQIGGRAIVGELTGVTLEPISINTVVWGTWKDLVPGAQVLSRNTGRPRSYGRDPYGAYYTERYLMFPVENNDKRLHPKDVVYGIEVEGVFKAYPEDDVLLTEVLVDELGGASIEVRTDGNGAVTFTNLDTGHEIVKERDFWFAWAAFHPDTLLYQ